MLGAAGISTQRAIGSGQELQRQLVNERNALVRAHTANAEDIRPWLLLFFVALAALLSFERKQRAGGPVAIRDPILAGTLVASLAFAGVSCYWVPSGATRTPGNGSSARLPAEVSESSHGGGELRDGLVARGRCTRR